MTATTPEELFEILIESIKKYHPSDDLTMVKKAFDIANAAHKGAAAQIGRALYRPSP